MYYNTSLQVNIKLKEKWPVMLEVKVNDKNSFEKAMRLFKKQCQKDGFLVELKERRFYCKPSERKRKKGKR